MKDVALTWLIGIDEAGRGPLAGPVSVGVFAVPNTFDMALLDGVRDSKKLSQKKREEWFKKLVRLENTRSAVAFSSPQLIDARGIVYAIQNAMNRALQKLTINPSDCTVLLDGSLKAPEEYLSQKTIIKGDVTEPVISVASILAKVKRDTYMLKIAPDFPHYAFQTHKGYGTKLHCEAIQEHGLSSLHRKSFCKEILKSRELHVKS